MIVAGPFLTDCMISTTLGMTVGSSRGQPCGDSDFLPSFGLYGRKGTFNVLTFDGISSPLPSLLNKVWFLVASWVSTLPLFQDIPITTTLRSWYEVAFSSIARPQCLPRWCPHSILCKLNGGERARDNPSAMGIKWIICESTGEVILSFSGLVNICKVNKAELEAMRISILEACALP